MTTYITVKGEEYKISEFNQKERECYDWLIEDSKSCISWLEFQTRTSHRTIETAKQIKGENWQQHPLYIIQIDLNHYLMIKYNEATGEHRELSDIIIE